MLQSNVQESCDVSRPGSPRFNWRESRVLYMDTPKRSPTRLMANIMIQL